MAITTILAPKMWRGRCKSRCGTEGSAGGRLRPRDAAVPWTGSKSSCTGPALVCDSAAFCRLKGASHCHSSAVRPIKWTGDFGFVHELVEKKLGDEIKNYEFYFAGPPPMTKSLQEALMLKHQVPFDQIHFDRFF